MVRSATTGDNGTEMRDRQSRLAEKKCCFTIFTLRPSQPLRRVGRVLFFSAGRRRFPEIMSQLLNMDDFPVKTWEPIDVFNRVGSHGVIVLDIRSSEEFDGSHWVHSTLVSLPQEKRSVSNIFKTMPYLRTSAIILGRAEQSEEELSVFLRVGKELKRHNVHIEIGTVSGGFECLRRLYPFLCFATGDPEEENNFDYPQQVNDYLFVGGYASARSLNSLKRLGITHVVNCAVDCGNDFHDSDEISVRYLHLGMYDLPSQQIEQFAVAGHLFIEEARAQNGRVLVHCVAGVSRSATIAAAHLFLSKQHSVESAVRFIRKRRTVARPLMQFVRQLEELQHVTVPASLRDCNGLVVKSERLLVLPKNVAF